MLGEGTIEVMRKAIVGTTQARLGFMKTMVKLIEKPLLMNYQKYSYDRQF